MGDRAAIGVALVPPSLARRLSAQSTLALLARSLRDVPIPGLSFPFRPRASTHFMGGRATALIPFHSNAKPRQSAAKISVRQGFPKRWPAGCDPSLLTPELTATLFCYCRVSEPLRYPEEVSALKAALGTH